MQWEKRKARLEEEIEAHIELETQENIEAGMPQEEVRQCFCGRGGIARDPGLASSGTPAPGCALRTARSEKLPGIRGHRRAHSGHGHWRSHCHVRHCGLCSMAPHGASASRATSDAVLERAPGGNSIRTAL